MSSEYQLFTDGACRGNPGPGGWAAIVRTADGDEELYGYDPETTNNRMELLAAIRGLEAIPAGAQVAVLSDSKYVVRGMNEWVQGWIRRDWVKADRKPVLNRELWQQLVALAGDRKVSWGWVEGHAGHTENERCDELANLAIDTRGGH